MNKVIEKYLSKRNVWFIIMLVCVSLISIGYAALNTTLSISGTATARAKSDIRVKNITLKSTSNHGSEVYSSRYSKDNTITSVSLPNETSTVTYTVTIHNYSNITYMLQDIQTIEDSNADITFNYSNDIIGDDIPKGEDMTFDITFTGSTSENKVKTLILKYIFVENNKYLFYEKVLADNVVTDGKPDFSSTNTSTGAFYKSTDNLGTTYYFRGNVTNNYVLFGGFYWRIVRINGNNSVRLIYQGTASDGNGTTGNGYYEDETKNAVNKIRNHSYVRYYYKSNSAEYSTIRKSIDSWYNTNLNSFANFMDPDAGYCNDYSTTSGTYRDSTSSSSVTFSGNGRLSSHNPTTVCARQYYETPTTSNTGTKSLPYPVGTISMDEVMQAGGSNSNNKNYYLHTGTSYFTMTPYEFEYKKVGVLYYYYPRVLNVNSSGKLASVDVYTKHGYRPVINIASYIYWSRGNGTATAPYELNFESVPSYQFTLTPTPSDAKVVLKVNGTTVFDGNGEAVISVKYKDVITYTVSKDGYLTYTNSYTSGKSNHNINVSLTSKSPVLATYIRDIYNNDTVKTDHDLNKSYYTYANSVGLIDDRKGGDVYNNGNIRYVGSNPNNYIYFNCSDYSNQSSSTCEKWRIVGVFDGKVKLVRPTSIGEYSWTSNTGNTINKWDPDTTNNYSGAAIMNLMNPGYDSLSVNNSLYWNSGSGNCYNAAGGATTSCDFTSTGLKNDTTRNLISNEKYYLYAPRTGELYADQLYVQERGASPGSQYDGSNDIPPMSRNGYWEGKVGLLYLSDHAYGATPGSCPLPVFNWPSPCLRSDWLAYETEERFITPSFKQSNVWFARKIGTLEGHINSGDAAEAINIRPVLYLYANQEFKAGDGTSSNPIQLKVN